MRSLGNGILNSVFTIIGIFAIIFGVAFGIKYRTPGAMCFIMVGLAFTVVGFIFICRDTQGNIKRAEFKKDLEEQGIQVAGTITAHRAGNGTVVNGHHPIDLVISAEVDGIDEVYVIPVETYNHNKYPVGWLIDIKVLGNRADIVRGTLRPGL